MSVVLNGTRTITGASFGKHICGMTDHLAAPYTPYHRLGGDSVRLWDCGVNWRKIETASKGVYSWTRLDSIMRQLRDGGAKNIMYCLGQAPDWATAQPGYNASYNPNPIINIQNMLDFLDDLLRRYPDINEVQIWNEPNSPDYWTGTVAQLVDYTVAVSAKCRSINKDIRVIAACPDCFENRGSYLQQYLSALSSAPDGLKSIDAIDFHIYVQPREPEYMLWLSRLLRGVVKTYGFDDLPIYATEFGWGTYIQNGVTQVPGDGVYMPDDLAQAYITRSFLVTLSMLDRVYFYAVDKFNFSKLCLIYPSDKSQKTGAGLALEYLSSFLDGANISFIKQLGVTWQLNFVTNSGRAGVIVWCRDGYTYAVDHSKYSNVLTLQGAQHVGMVGNIPVICIF